MPNKHHHHKQLNEGLRAKDLKDQVDPVFTIDQYRSKMGEDKDVVVIGFRVTDKYPAIDLMEFIEKGYTFILDADMSTGEERDGKYQVFVELERTQKIPGQIKNMLEGIGQLCDIYDWKFRYYRSPRNEKFSEESILEHVPCTPEDYDSVVMEGRSRDVYNFFDQGHMSSITFDNNQTITFDKPFSEKLQLKLESLGPYEQLKDKLPGAIQLDETSRNQTIYLEKYLGNYEIHKINDKFLIRNGDRAAIVSKSAW